MTLVRWTFPGVTKRFVTEPVDLEQSTRSGKKEPIAYMQPAVEADSSETDDAQPPSDALTEPSSQPSAPVTSDSKVQSVASSIELLPLAATSRFSDKKHRIYSVPGDYLDNFPDVQEVQYPSALQWGITPMHSRDEFDSRSQQLVYVGTNPYIHLDEQMTQSIPYLVPRASDLLEHLGKAFMDSLYAKRIPLHKFVVSSVLRTETDVARLSTNNVNATERSCHLFGTTFDISYNRYYTVSSPDGPARREVGNDSLKMVLSEVLRDARLEGRCYVRYEKKQPCFHITVR